MSNCVLNLVATEQKTALFDGIFRGLRRGGQAAISDIVSSTEVPERPRADPALWNGCSSGALQPFLAAIERAGFHSIHLVKRDASPGRSWKASRSCGDGRGLHGQARRVPRPRPGRQLPRPVKAVFDDDGHVLEWGVLTAVCTKSSSSTPAPLPSAAPQLRVSPAGGTLLADDGAVAPGSGCHTRALPEPVRLRGDMRARSLRTHTPSSAP